MKEQQPILVYGSGEFGEVVRQLAVDCGHPFAGFIDDWNPARAGVLGGWETVKAACPSSQYVLAMAVGYKHLQKRWGLYQDLRASGYGFPSLVHPGSLTHSGAQVAPGAMIMAGAIVDSTASVGEISVVWPGVVVSHHSSIAGNCFLSPNATICGVSSIGAASFVGAGAVVVDHMAVPAESFIKAGSVYAGRKT